MASIGEIYYYSHNTIVWRVPDFSVLLQLNQSPIYSPYFQFRPEFNKNFPKNPSWYFEPLPNHVGLIFTSKERSDTSTTRCIKFGVLDRNNIVIGRVNGEFIEDEDDTGHFRIRSLVKDEIVRRPICNPIRIFAEASANQVLNAFSQGEISNGNFCFLFPFGRLYLCVQSDKYLNPELLCNVFESFLNETSVTVCVTTSHFCVNDFNM